MNEFDLAQTLVTGIPPRMNNIMNNLRELRGILYAMFKYESDDSKLENLDMCMCLLDLAIDQLEKPKNGFSGNFKIYGEKEKEEDKSDAHESENDYKVGDEVFSVLIKIDHLVAKGAIPGLTDKIQEIIIRKDTIIEEDKTSFVLKNAGWIYKSSKIKNLILGKTLQEATKRLSEIMNDV